MYPCWNLKHAAACLWKRRRRPQISLDVFWSRYVRNINNASHRHVSWYKLQSFLWSGIMITKARIMELFEIDSDRNCLVKYFLDFYCVFYGVIPGKFQLCAQNDTDNFFDLSSNSFLFYISHLNISLVYYYN